MFAVVSLEDSNGDRDRWVMKWPLPNSLNTYLRSLRVVAGPYKTKPEADAALLRWEARAERQAQLEWQDTAPYYQDVTSKEGLI